MRLVAVGTPKDRVLNAYIASRSRVSIITGPLGSGKTTASCQRILMHMLEQEPNRYGVRPTRILVCRNTYPDLLSTTAETFKAFFFPDETAGSEREDPDDLSLPKLPKLGRWYGGGEEPPRAVFDFLNDEDNTVVKSTVYFLALDRPSDVRRLLGIEFTWIYLSECKELEKSIVDMLDLRHGRFPSDAQGRIRPTFSGMFGDTNAPDTEHWIHQLAERDKPDTWAFFRQPGGLLEDPRGRAPDGRKRWLVNPAAENLGNLPAGYYAEGQKGKRDDWVSVYLANEYGFVAGGKPVHPDYVDSIHCTGTELEASEYQDLVVGYDFGRTPAAVIVQWQPGMGRWAALAEFVTDDMSAASFAPTFKAWLGREFSYWASRGKVRGWGDPAGDHPGQATDDTPIRILNSHGLPCRPAPTNDPLLRRSALVGPLMRGTMDGRRAFLISTRCEVTRKGLMGGWDFPRINKIGVELYHDQPAKNRYSHPCFVAGTMISTPDGPRAIETLRPGDCVETPIGPRRVAGAFSRPSVVREYQCEDGRTVTATPDHPLLSVSGCFVPIAEALEYGVRILTEESPAWILSKCLRSAQRRVRASSYSRAFATTAWEAVTGAMARVGSYSTARSGSQLAVRFPLATTSIIEMAIRAITGLRISSASRRPPIGVLTFGLPSAPRFSGDEPTRGSRAGSVRRAGLPHGAPSPSVVPRLPSVSAAAHPFCERSTEPRPTARRSASARRAARVVSTTNAGAARAAARAFWLTATAVSGSVRVVAASPLESAVVFNIEVEDAHSYFAEGIAAKNCEALEYALVGEGEAQQAIQPASSRYGHEDVGQEYAEM